MSADRNLLFGILALQMDFISRDALVEAMNAWVLDKKKSLGQILVERGALRENAQSLLELLVEKHLEMHDGQPHKSLASVAALAQVRDDLQGVADPDLHATLASTLLPGEATPQNDHTPSPAADTRTDPPASPGKLAAGSPTASGPRFRVLRPHARGGLGEVFLARDEELGRDVALKEIQLRHADDPDSQARFLLEGEVTGNLEHPGIVPVYGLGRYPDGRPYYAMRFIRGDSLLDAISRLHHAEKPDHDSRQRAPDLRQLLGRVVAVCNAIAYAHSRGVLHRDLKPENIMLGPYGETLVVDWGLAKAVGRPEGVSRSAEGTLRPSSSRGSTPTQMGSAIGTPAYMSPEQAAGQLDLLGPPSDVYSLGTTLYHLIAGKAPFEGGDVTEIVRRVQAGEFPPPRRVKAAVPAALEAVCLKAMALKPEERYATAQALADEIEHWLADEPVAAYHEPWAVRAGRWVRRHRTKVTAAVAAAVVAMASLAVVTLLLAAANQREREAREEATRQRDEARLQKERADQERDEATRQKERADGNLAKARKAVEDYCTHVADDERLKQADFYGLRKKLLQTAVPYYQEFVRQRGDHPELKAERGRASGRLAYLLSELGEDDEAIRQCRQMLAVFDDLVQAHPEVPAYRQSLASSYHNLAILLDKRGSRAEAKAASQVAVAGQKKLARDFPNVPEYLQELATSYNNLGIWLWEEGDLEKAGQAHREALAIREKLARDFPRSLAYRQELAQTLNNLGNLLGKRDDATVTLSSCQHLLALLVRGTPPRRPVEGDDRRSGPSLKEQVEEALADSEDNQDAVAVHRRALAIREKLCRDFPAVPACRQDLASSYNNLGNLLKARGREEEAEGAYLKAVAIQEKLAKDIPSVPLYQQDLARGLNNLGVILGDRGRLKESEVAHRRALTIREKLVQDFPGTPAYAMDLGGTYTNMGWLMRESQKPEAACDWCGKAIAKLQTVLTNDPRQATARQFLRNAHWNRAEARSKLSLHEEAIKDWDRAIELDEGPNRVRFRLRRSLSHARTGKGDYSKAVADAVALSTSSVPSSTLYDAACVCALASVSVKADASRADKYAGCAVKLLTRAMERGHFKNAAKVAHMKKDSDLDSLRSRGDFKKLVAELEAGLSPRK
jgi:serine/threonine-protein kinase